MYKTLLSVLVISVLCVLSVSFASAALLAPESEVGTDSQAAAEAASYTNVQASLEEGRSKHLVQAGGNYGLDRAAGSQGAGLRGVGSEDLATRIGQIIFAILGFVGVIFLVFTIYGGFLWMTAGGNTQKVSEGAAYIKNGAIGVIIILSAYAITFFVIEIVTQDGGSSSSGACAYSCVPTGSCSGTIDPGTCGTMEECCKP